MTWLEALRCGRGANGAVASFSPTIRTVRPTPSKPRAATARLPGCAGSLQEAVAHAYDDVHRGFQPATAGALVARNKRALFP